MNIFEGRCLTSSKPLNFGADLHPGISVTLFLPLRDRAIVRIFMVSASLLEVCGLTALLVKILLLLFASALRYTGVILRHCSCFTDGKRVPYASRSLL